MKRFLLIICVFLTYSSIYSQTTICDPNITSLCETGPFPAATSGTASAPTGTFYDCNPTVTQSAFFYFEAGVNGPLSITIPPTDINGNVLTNDLDYFCWGPFASTTNMCNQLTALNVIDCSVAGTFTAPIETINIPNANAGSIYVILVENWGFNPSPCFIEFNPSSPFSCCDFAGDNNTINPCTTDPPFNLITGLNNQPDNNGFWINSSNNSVDSIFDPSIDTSGTYMYIIAGTASCPSDTALLTVNILNGTNISITSSPTACDGDSPLTLTASTSGGTFSGPNVIGNIFTPDVSVLGNNTIQYLYQSNGCSDTAIQTLTVFESPTVTNIIINHPECFGDASGTAIVTASGGTPDASGNYIWNWFGMDPLALPAGVFNYEITDINGCTFLDNVTIFTPQNTLGNLISYNSSCYNTNNGSISVNLGTGGPISSDSVSILTYCDSHPYATTSVQPSAIIEEVILNGDNNNINNNTAGVADFYEDYTALMYSDMTLGQPYSISVTLNGIGSTGSSTNNSGAKVYIDYNFDSDFNDPGEEIGVVPYRTTATLGVPEIINFTVPTNTGTGATRMRVVSQYRLDQNPFLIGPCDAPAPGTFDQPWYGATEDYSIVLNEPLILADFIWDNGSSTFNAASDSIANLSPGMYVVTIIPSTGCSAQDTAIILEPEQITFNPTITDISCNDFTDGAVILNPSGGYGGAYNINWGGNDSSALADGSYTVTVTDASTITTENTTACFNDTLITLVEPDYFSVDFAVSDYSICAGDAINLEFDFNTNGVAPFTINYNANGPQTEGPVSNSGQYSFSVSPSITTTYSINSIVDADGCINQNTTNNKIVNVNPIPNMNLAVNPSPICVGDNSTLIMNNNLGTPPFNVDYSITDANGTTFLNEVFGSGGFNTSINPIITTDYALVSVTDDSTCTSSLSAVTTLVVNEMPQLVTSYSNELCDGELLTIDLEFTAGTPPFDVDYTFNGTNTNTTINFLTGDLTLIATDPSNITINSIANTYCSKQIDEDIVITINSLPITTLSGDGSICGGGTTDLSIVTTNGAPLYDIEYTNGTENFTLTDIGDSTGISTATMGLYTLVSVIDQNGCEATTLNGQANVNINPLPDVALVAYPLQTEITDPLINFIDKSTYLSLMPGTWDFGDGSGQVSNLGHIDHMYADTGTYIVSLETVSDSGCTNIAYQTIIISPTFTMYVPNAFTPNNDLDNDYFLPIVNGVQEYELSIYDRLGKRVFRTDKYTNEYCTTGCNEAWDGKINGSSDYGTIGVYVYHIIVTDVNGKLRNYEGTVTLVR